MTSLESKLATFDALARQAVDNLLQNLVTNRDALTVLAKGRHVDGHYRYGDTNLKEWSDEVLYAELMQELADAIVYQVERIWRGADS